MEWENKLSHQEFYQDFNIMVILLMVKDKVEEN